MLGATIPELVVVGGTTLAGANQFQTAPYVKISAVADLLVVSSGAKDPDLDEYVDITKGTSFCKFLRQTRILTSSLTIISSRPIRCRTSQLFRKTLCLIYIAPLQVE